YLAIIFIKSLVDVPNNWETSQPRPDPSKNGVAGIHIGYIGVAAFQISPNAINVAHAAGEQTGFFTGGRFANGALFNRDDDYRQSMFGRAAIEFSVSRYN